MRHSSLLNAHIHSEIIAYCLFAGLSGLIIGHAPDAVCAAEPVQLTTDHLFKRDPVFVGRGTEIVYVVLSRPEQLRLMRLTLADGSSQPLHKDETRSELEPAFSSNGRFYAFLQSRTAASVAIVIRDTQRGQHTEIPPLSGFAGIRSPCFSPDGKRLIYCLGEEGRQKIFSVNTAAGDLKTLLDGPGINNWPSFSPDGAQLLFGSTRDGNYEIYLANADGSGVRRITNHPSQDIRPRFSPDGQQIAFTSNRDGNYEVYVMRVDGSNVTRITDHPERDDFPAWHPDGQRLVMMSERAGRYDLYLVSTNLTE